jgi:DNA-binding CsgD family transcriptional regulator/tetratricopeptide (TPR) repeat protein
LIPAPVFCPYFIGRRPELAFLIERRRDLGKAHGGLILVGGDAGIGKSRLVREFLDTTGRSRGWVAVGRCRPFASAPYEPLTELLATLVPGAAPLSPAETQDAQLRSIAQALLAVARKHAVVAVIEDLHWSDSGTLDVLALLAERLATSRMLVIATYRDDELGAGHPHYAAFGALQRNRSVTGIALAPLDAGEVRDFIDATLSAAPAQVPPDLRRQVATVAEGNPFFTEELLKGVVDREQGRNAERSLPTTVHAAILERIGRLTQPEREILTQAAVIGRRFEAGILAHTLDAQVAAILPVLQRARELQIVAETDEPATFRFRHALTREAIYDQLLAAQRRPLHRRIALALEAQSGPNAALEALAYHWWAAGDGERAITYGERGGDAAQALHAYADSLECYERTQSLLDPNGPDAARLHAKMGLCFFRLGFMDRASDHYGRAWSFFETASEDASFLFILARGLAAAIYNAGRARESSAFLRQAVDVVTRLGDHRVTERARLTLAAYLSDLGEVEETRSVLAGIDREHIADDTGLTITFWQATCRVCALQGDIAGVCEAAERICAIAANSAVVQPADAVAVLDGLREAGFSALIIGATAVARQCLDRALDTCEPLRWSPNHGDLLLDSASERVLEGAFDEARSLVARGLPMIGEVQSAQFAAVLATLALGTALDDRDLLRHEPRAAFVERAFDTGMPGVYGPLAAFCAQLRAARGEHDAALSLLRRALRAACAALPSSGSFPLVVVAAQLGTPADAAPIRALCAATADTGPAPSHAADLAEAILRFRFDAGSGSATEPARRAAAGFAAIGWPVYEALAREAAGDRRSAQAIRERIGYRGRSVLETNPAADSPAPVLTARELEVARLVASGRMNREIAIALSVSVKLVEKHLSSIYEKLAIRSRSQLTAHIIAGNAEPGRPTH